MIPIIEKYAHVWRAVGWVLTIVLAFGRVSIARLHEVQITAHMDGAMLYKDLAHITVGAFFGVWVVTGSRTAGVLAWSLTALEVVCFLLLPKG